MNDPSRPIPPTKNMKRVGAVDEEAFISAGDLLTSVIDKATKDRHFAITSDTKVLDWGCGAGRVAFPFCQRFDAKLYACDVDNTAIEFINKQNPEFTALESGYEPPLPFEDNYFDMVYGFSVFTHLPADMEQVWLEELRRITCNGALLILSVIGKKCLEINQARGNDKHVTWKAIEQKGFDFKAHAVHKKDPTRWPGVTGEYGVTVHHPDYIHKMWGKYFSKIEIVEAGADGQDLVICTPKAMNPPAERVI